MTLSHADFLKKYLQGTAQLGVNQSRIGNVLGSPVYQAAFRRSDYASMLNILGKAFVGMMVVVIVLAAGSPYWWSWWGLLLGLVAAAALYCISYRLLREAVREIAASDADA
jgi:predicted membrane protein